MSFTFCILQSCSTEDLINNVENDKVALYGAEVNQYFSSLERNSTQEEIVDIQKLKGSINKVTLKEYDLHANQKLLIADIMPQDDFRKNSKTKIIFYFFGDEIFRSSIIVFQDDYLAYDYNRTLHTMLSEENKKQFKYTGQVEMFTIKKKLEFRGTLQDGRLVKSAAVRILKKKIKINARSSGCIDYYLVTTVGNTVVSAQFLYTICDVNNGDTTGGGSGFGGDGSYSSGSFIILPVSPQEDDIHTHRDSDNIVTTYKFKDNVWKITGVVLPDLVLKSGRESNYGFLNFEFPDHDQIVFGDDGLSYKYNSFSGNWTGNEMMLVTEPCLKIDLQLDNQLIKEKIDALKGKTANKNEAGIVQKKAGTFIDMIATANSNELNMPPGTDFIGSMHTHQDPYPSGRFRENGTPIMLRPIPIFSPTDIVQFLEFLNNTKLNNAPLEDVYSMVISSSSTYQLRFSGNIDEVRNNFDILDLNNKYLKSIKDNGNDEKLGFLKFLEETIGIKGIDLYEINKDNTTNKISLVNNNLSKTPCN
ncbi:hypothetical protein [Flavobacterium sp. XS2P14]|uniref:hypothetical protein n=1 Tax=Flavobacterium sp. XS2P14 TaxID=3401735 RepID=UPI003AAF9EEB